MNEEVRLSTLVDALNDRFSTNFNLADQLFFDQVEAGIFRRGPGLSTARNAHTTAGRKIQ